MREGVARMEAHMPGIPAPHISLARMLIMAGDLVGMTLEHALRPFGLSRVEFRTLAMIFAGPDGRTHPSELCQFATQKPTNMTRIIDGLVRSGLVTRTPSSEDRRRIVLQITAAGRKLTQQVVPQLFPYIKSLFKGFSDSERQQFETLVQKLIHNLDKTYCDNGLQP